MMEFSIKGLTTPPVTVYKENGDVDLDIIPAYVKHLQDFGITNVFVTGTTGECMLLTLDERRRLADRWVKEAKGKLENVIVHIGTGNMADSKELAKHAEEVGVDAIACVGTSYYKPESLESFVKYMAGVASAAPKTPFLLYDIEPVTGIKLLTNDFFHKAKGKIPTLVGVKHTTPSLININNCIHDHPNIKLFLGTDAMYLEGLSIGVELNINNSFNGNVLNRVREAFKKGDLVTARKEQNLALQAANVRMKHALSRPKWAKLNLRLLGLPVGDPRLPLDPITEEELAAVKQDLDKIGFFEWATRK